MKVSQVVFLFAVLAATQSTLDNCPDSEQARQCREQFRPGQFYCESPNVDTGSQSIAGCGPRSGTVEIPCYAAPNVTCGLLEYNESQCIFTETLSCTFVNGQRYNYYVAVGLSLFLGMFGIDRFYLGYPAIGLLKLCTMGFLFIGHLLDFLLILVQAVGPADRSGYYAPFYGPLVSQVDGTNPYLPISNDTCV